MMVIIDIIRNIMMLNGCVGVGRAGNSQGSGKTGRNMNLLAHEDSNYVPN